MSTQKYNHLYIFYPSENSLRQLSFPLMCGTCIRKFGEVLSGDRDTPNALWTVVKVVNRLAYFRLTHNAKHNVHIIVIRRYITYIISMSVYERLNTRVLRPLRDFFQNLSINPGYFFFVVPSMTIVEKC